MTKPWGEELKALVAGRIGKPLALKDIKFASDISETRNAKVMRQVSRATYLSEDTSHPSSLLNPEVGEEIRQIAAANNKRVSSK